MGERRERGSEVQTRVGGESVDRSIKKGRHREPLKKWIYSTYVGGVRAKIVLKGKIANDRGERKAHIPPPPLFVSISFRRHTSKSHKSRRRKKPCRRRVIVSQTSRVYVLYYYIVLVQEQEDDRDTISLLARSSRLFSSPPLQEMENDDGDRKGRGGR